jgi:hypothetical protein
MIVYIRTHPIKIMLDHISMNDHMNSTILSLLTIVYAEHVYLTNDQDDFLSLSLSLAACSLVSHFRQNNDSIDGFALILFFRRISTLPLNDIQDFLRY